MLQPRHTISMSIIFSIIGVVVMNISIGIIVIMSILIVLIIHGHNMNHDTFVFGQR